MDELGIYIFLISSSHTSPLLPIDIEPLIHHGGTHAYIYINIPYPKINNFF